MQLRYANKFFQNLTNGPTVEAQADLKGSIRYMAHLDDEDKCPYDPNDIIVLGNLDISKFLDGNKRTLSQSAIDWIKLYNLIIDEDITDMSEFEKIMFEQDTALFNSVQCNINLRTRAKDLIRARSYTALNIRAEHMADRKEKEFCLKMARKEMPNAVLATVEARAHELYMDGKYGISGTSAKSQIEQNQEIHIPDFSMAYQY
jgi:hypothetical protein